MKKCLYSMLALFTVLALSMTSCDNGSDSPPPPSNTVTITFSSNGGSAVASTTIEKDGTLPLAYFPGGNKAPTQSGKTFTGWKNGSTDVTAQTTFPTNTTLTAQWTAQSNTVHITFDTGAGSTVDAIDINNNTALPSSYFGNGANAPTLLNYKFGGWLDGTTLINQGTKFTTNKTLTAKWTLQVTVSFSLGSSVSGIPPNPIVIDAGTAIGTKYPANPKQNGLVFNGWYNNETIYGRNDVINSDSPTFLLTAQWTADFAPETAQSPAIHPGNHFSEIPGGAVRTWVKNQVYTVEGLFSNIEPNAGVLSSQWYRSTTENGAGEEIDYKQNATSSPHELALPFVWSESEVGVYWYWVVVTNTNDNATVNKTSSSITQNRLKVTVTD